MLYVKFFASQKVELVFSASLTIKITAAVGNEM